MKRGDIRKDLPEGWETAYLAIYDYQDFRSDHGAWTRVPLMTVSYMTEEDVANFHEELRWMRKSTGYFCTHWSTRSLHCPIGRTAPPVGDL